MDKMCSKCKRTKPLDLFMRRKDIKSGYGSLCKKCANKQMSELKKKNPVFAQKQRESYMGWYWKNREYENTKWKQWRDDLKLTIFKHYSNSIIPFCNCCGEKEVKFLCIDHIDGGGNKERKEKGKRGTAFYSSIIKRNFPPIYQILCHNCNMAKHHYKKCPHVIQ